MRSNFANLPPSTLRQRLRKVFNQVVNLGADLVVHATTKYLNGHDDVGVAIVLSHPKYAPATCATKVDDRWIGASLLR